MSFSEQNIENLIFAAFFHDTGMALNTNTDHGMESRQVLVDFIQKKSLSPQSFLDALVVVEHHDDKEYSYLQRIGSRTASQLIRILTVSDDLDAFGRLGALRYCEIYLLRGHKPEALPGLILPNLDKRYDHLDTQYGFLTEFMKVQSKRYGLTRSFFEDLKGKQSKNGSKNAVTGGPSGVVQLLMKWVLIEKKGYSHLITKCLQSTDDIYTKHFFEGLKEESENSTIEL